MFVFFSLSPFTYMLIGDFWRHKSHDVNVIQIFFLVLATPVLADGVLLAAASFAAAFFACFCDDWVFLASIFITEITRVFVVVVVVDFCCCCCCFGLDWFDLDETIDDDETDEATADLLFDLFAVAGFCCDVCEDDFLAAASRADFMLSVMFDDDDDDDDDVVVVVVELLSLLLFGPRAGNSSVSSLKSHFLFDACFDDDSEARWLRRDFEWRRLLPRLCSLIINARVLI